jgi:pectate lyase
VFFLFPKLPIYPISVRQSASLPPEGGTEGGSQRQQASIRISSKKLQSKADIEDLLQYNKFKKALLRLIFVENETMIRFAWFVLFFSLLFSACTEETMIRQGDVLSESFSLEQTDTLFLSSDTISQAALTITGENLVFDFGGLTIIGTDTPTLPDQFTGLAIEVKNGKNITIKNLNIHGFKIALLANEIENLTIDSCNFSYNYRQRLKSTREKEDLSDWLYFHQNDQDEWLRYGAGIYLRASR